MNDYLIVTFIIGVSMFLLGMYVVNPNFVKQLRKLEDSSRQAEKALKGVKKIRERDIEINKIHQEAIKNWGVIEILMEIDEQLEVDFKEMKEIVFGER